MKSCSWHDSLAHTRFTSRTHAPPKKSAQDSVWAWGLSPPKGLMLESPLPHTRCMRQVWPLISGTLGIYLTQVSRARQHSRPCPQRVRRPASVGIHLYIQPLPVPVCSPHLLQTDHHCPIPKKPSITWLNDYHPVALISIIMKCFEGLVRTHICSTLPDTLDPLQIAYRPTDLRTRPWP